jgi:uncharacterized repeat protein (TIGR01451 family)
MTNTKKAVIAAIVLLAVAGIGFFAWKYRVAIRQLLSRAEENYIDLSWGDSTQDSTVYLGCPGYVTSDGRTRVVNFTATLTNYGNVSAANVEVAFRPTRPGDAPGSVNEEMPEGSSIRADGYDSARKIWAISSIAAGGSVSAIVTIPVPVASEFSMEVEVMQAQGAGGERDIDSTPANGANTEEDDNLKIGCAGEGAGGGEGPPPTGTNADVSLTKTAQPTALAVDGTTIFTITVRNDGPGSPNVSVKDLLPQGATYVSHTVSQGTYNQTTGVWNVGILQAPGGNNANVTATLRITARIPQAGTVTNTAEVFFSSLPDPDSTPNNNVPTEDDQASASVTATQTPPPAVSCTPETQTVRVSQLVEVSASGGTGSFSWSAPGGSPESGSGTSFTTTYEATGTKTITVTSGTAQDSCTVTIEPASAPGLDVSITKTANPATVLVGENTTFTITVTNEGPDNASTLAITDVLPQDTTYVSHTTSQGTYNQTTGVWNVGALDKDASATLQIVATVIATGTKTNTATVSSVTPNDYDTSNNTASASVTASQPAQPRADLSLTKTASSATVPVNSNVVFSITVLNSGPNAASNVSVKDVLPQGVGFLTSIPTHGSYNHTTGIWTIGDLAVGASAGLLLEVKVIQAGAIVNTAEVFSSSLPDPDSTPNNNVPTEDDQASASLSGTQTSPEQADLSLTKVTSNATPSLGQQIVYSITVFNSGPNAASNVSVKDVLPLGVTFVSATATAGSYNSSTNIWTVGTLTVGNNASLQITVTVNATGSVTNTAEVFSSSLPDPDSTPNNNVPTEDDQASTPFVVTTGGGNPTGADLSLTKTVSNTNPKVGQEIVYVITVFNSGPQTATNVRVADLLPSSITYLSHTVSSGSYDHTSGVWTVGTVNVGANAMLHVTGRVNAQGTIINTGQVSASDQTDPDSTPNNNVPTEDDQASVSVTATLPPSSPTPQADLRLTKTANSQSVQVGSQAIYTVSVSNAGPDVALNVSVKDLLPQGAQFVSALATQGTYSSATGIWTIGTLPASASVSMQIIVKLTQQGTITNTAEVFSSSLPDPDSTPNNNVPTEDDQASVAVTVTSIPVLVPAGINSLGPMFVGLGFMIGVCVVYFLIPVKIRRRINFLEEC